MAMGISSSRRGGGRRGRRTPMADINVTPFVDVMLVLLIIFMVTAPLLNSGVPIDLPDSRADALPTEQEPVTLSIGSNGVIYLNDEPLSETDLPARLAAIPPGEDGARPQITLRGDRVIDYGRVMAVMGELNRAGFTSIALVTNGVSAQPSIAQPASAPPASAPSASEQADSVRPAFSPLSDGSSDGADSSGSDGGQ